MTAECSFHIYFMDSMIDNLPREDVYQNTDVDDPPPTIKASPLERVTAVA